MSSAGPVGGSSIDVLGLVSQLVAAERRPLDEQLKRAHTKVATQVSAMGSLLGALSSFQGALQPLKSSAAFMRLAAASSDVQAVAVSAGQTAVPGSYDVQVQRLATAQQLSSGAFSSADAHVGTGVLTLSLGDKSMDVSIGEDRASLSAIRDAINQATNNPGIRATLINGSDGAHLILTSAHTGESQRIAVSASGGDGGLSALAYSSDAPGSFTQIRAAQDAIAVVAGHEVRSATNVMEDVIDGVTLSLNAATSAAVRIEVRMDHAAAMAAVDGFVNAYNALRAQLTRLGGYDAASQNAGPMLGDALLNGIDSQLRRLISSQTSAGGEFDSLASIGITTQRNGSLGVDQARLQAVLADDPAAVGRLFSAHDGIATRLHDQIATQLGEGAAIDVRNASLANEQRALEKRADTIEARMQIVHKRYMQQFTALDTLLSSLQTTSSFLGQQLQSLANMNQK